MDNSSYPTDDRRDYDDRPTNYEESGSYSRGLRPRRERYADDGYPRRGYNSEDGGSRRDYSSGNGGLRRNYNSEDSGSRRPHNQGGYGRPQGPRRPYNSEDGDSRRPNYGKPRNGYGPNRNFNSENDGRRNGYSEVHGRQKGNFSSPRRSYYADDSEPRRPYNQGGYGERRNTAPHRNYNDETFEPRRPHHNSENRGAYRNFNSKDGESRRPYSSEGGSSRRPNYGYGKPRNSARNAYNSGPRKSGGSGIDRMLSRKPQVDDNRWSDNDMVKLPIKEEVRLNKFIADSGICSRREADNFILAGVVTVNGKVVTELGVKVNKFNDDVRFNGERLKGEAKVYIVMNKPKGYVTTTTDPHAEKTVMELLKSCTSRVTPVGRLDKNTTGVLMFTNDGEIAEKLTHPSYNKKKIYEATLTSDLSQEDYEKILAGIPLSDGVIAADELEYVDENNRKKLGIEIHSGKNRIVRRIFESLGYTVKSLDRVYFAGLTKKGVKRGDWRYLTEAEVNILKMGAYN